MESRPARGYLDLLVALGWLALAAAATVLPLDGPARLALFVPTTVFLPGYAVVSLAYPTAGSPPEESTIGASDTGLRKAFSRGGHAIGGVERVALAVVWSLVVVPAVALGVHFSPYPISVRPIRVGVFGVTLALTLGAVLSRARQPEDERFSPSLPSLPSGSSEFDGSPMSSGSPSSGLGTTWSRGLLAVSLLVLASSVGYAFVAPPHDAEFTELYVQSGDVTDETTSLYPSTLVRGQTRPLTFAVTNREGSSVEYGYVVALQRIDRPGSGDGAPASDRSGAGNGSTASDPAGSGNVSAEVVAGVEVDRGGFELAEGATRNVTARVTPQTAGDDLRIVVLLYRGDPPSDPNLGDAYRSLRLPINVTANGGNATDTSGGGAATNSSAGGTTVNSTTANSSASDSQFDGSALVAPRGDR